MALSTPALQFGIHSISLYNADTGLPYGMARVVGNGSINQTGETNPLYGGSNPHPWAVERGDINTEITLAFNEMHDMWFQTLLGSTVTVGSAETGGAATTITNLNGTSAVASTGIASVGVKSGSEADVKFGTYVVKVASATTVDVYCLSDVDFARGTDLTYQDDALKITASALTITQSSAVTIPNCGLELTGDSGTIGMTTGDTAIFRARPINTANRSVVVGADSQTFPDFGMYITAKKRGNGQLIGVDVFRCAGIGLPLGFERNTWGNSEVTIQAQKDTAQGGVYRLDDLTASV